MCSRVYLDGSLGPRVAAAFPSLPALALLENADEASGRSGRSGGFRPGDILPTDFTRVIHVPAGKREPEWRHASWGFLPPGERDLRKQAQFINARAETVLDRPLWREAVRNPAQRCLVPVSGFYEWPDGVRHKVKPVKPAPRAGGSGEEGEEGEAFWIAGLLSWAMGPEGRFFTFTIVTTAPSAEFAPFHDRMPALLSREDADRWMTEENVETAAALLRPAPEGTLAAEESATKPVQERLL